jgi:hypothetical protein
MRGVKNKTTKKKEEMNSKTQKIILQIMEEKMTSEIKKLFLQMLIAVAVTCVTFGMALNAGAENVTDLTIGSGELITGQILGSDGSYIAIEQGGTLVHDSGDTSSAAIDLLTSGYTVEISGTINSSVENSNAIAGQGTNVVINSTASINVGQYITHDVATVLNYADLGEVRGGFTATDSIINYGDFSTTDDFLFREAASITNYGTVTSNSGGIIWDVGEISGPLLTQLDNYGKMITSEKSITVKSKFGTAIINNYEGAELIAVEDKGIDFRNATSGIINNWGLISSTDDTIKTDGGEGSHLTVLNYEGATITGTDNGIDADGDVTVYNWGIVSADGDTAINSDGSGTVINYGTIQSGTPGDQKSKDSDGIDFDYSLHLDNYGTISAQNEYVAEAISMGSGSIINRETGAIYSANEGIRVVGLSYVANRPAMGSTSIINNGTIEAEKGTAIYFGGNNDGTDYGHYVNNNGGTLVGGGGVAVQFAGGDDEFEFGKDGGTVIGDINGMEGYDTLSVNTTRSHVQVFDDDILDFEELTKKQYGTLILNGYAQVGYTNLVRGNIIVNGTLDSADGILVGSGKSSSPTILSGTGTILGDITLKGTLSAGSDSTASGNLTVSDYITIDTNAIIALDIISETDFDTIDINGFFSTTAEEDEVWYLDLFFQEAFNTEENVLGFNIWSALELLGGYSEDAINKMMVRYNYYASGSDGDFTVVTLSGGVIGGPSEVPVPGTLSLMFGALVFISAASRRRNASCQRLPKADPKG